MSTAEIDGLNHYHKQVVEQTGPACHTNRRSCFYTAVREGAEVEILAPEQG